MRSVSRGVRSFAARRLNPSTAAPLVKRKRLPEKPLLERLQHNRQPIPLINEARQMLSAELLEILEVRASHVLRPRSLEGFS